MKYLLTALKDELTGYQTPICSYNEPTALRDFEDAVTNPTIANHSKNYSLWKIGEYDTETGIIDTSDVRMLVEASSLVRKKK